MTRARPVAAVLAGLTLLVGAGFVLNAPAEAQPAPECGANPAPWGCAWDEGFVDGMTVTGDAVTLAGTFRPPSGTTVSRVRAWLFPSGSDPDCSLAEQEQVFEAPPSGSSTTSSTSSTTTTTTQAPDGSVHFEIPVAPRCNGRYNIEARAYLANEVQSPPLELFFVQVSLRPPPASGPVDIEGEPGQAVTISWSPPAPYAEDEAGPPPDFAGYRVERAHGAGEYAEVAVVDGDTTSVTDEAMAAATPGSYRYRVHALRRDAPEEEATTLLTSRLELAPVAVHHVAGADTTTTTARPPTSITVPGGSGGGGRRPPVTLPRGGGTPNGPTVAPDTGFSEALDYSDFEFGTEEAVPPADADAFLEFDDEGEDAPGEALAQPIAVASCLAMWAFHLRYLSRRADQLA